MIKSNESVCSSFCSSLGMMRRNPGRSCSDIYQINKATRERSDYYWINTTTGVHQVFCDMELECGGHKGGWMRIADLDISRGDECPTGWMKSTANDVGQITRDICRAPTTANLNPGCWPTNFTVNGTSYRKICGKARGYQRYNTEAFGWMNTQNTLRNQRGINRPYVDGISITLGNPRRHVWTYAVGHSEQGQASNNHYCPCAATSGAPAPHFVGNHYYCESGFAGSGTANQIFYTNDPLWDGSGCTVANNNCCANAGMPWFYREFPIPQQDDIEVRLCADENHMDEGTGVDQLQLFVKY